MLINVQGQGALLVEHGFTRLARHKQGQIGSWLFELSVLVGKSDLGIISLVILLNHVEMV